MHKGILSQWLNNHAVIGHAVRAAALLRVVEAVQTGGRLSLTHLGRHLGGVAHVKRQIKAVDRLLSNERLHREHRGIYLAIARTLLRGNRQPFVVDWSDFPTRARLRHVEGGFTNRRSRAVSDYDTGS